VQIDGVEAHRPFAHDLDQTAGIDGDLGDIRAYRGQKQVKKTQTQQTAGDFGAQGGFVLRAGTHVAPPEGIRCQDRDALLNFGALGCRRIGQPRRRVLIVDLVDDLVHHRAAFGVGIDFGRLAGVQRKQCHRPYPNLNFGRRSSDFEP